MRPFYLLLLPLVAAGPALADDCTKDVLAAFGKQHAAKAYRVEFSQPTAEGEARMKIDYMPPDKMLQTMTTPANGEQQTMLVGNHAYSGAGGAFEELQPQFTQSIIAEAQQAMGPPPADLGNYECLGPSKFEEHDFAAYRTVDKAPAGTDPSKVLTRTIYIDRATQLPAYNVVAPMAANANPLLKIKYSYPTDIAIVAPANAPAQKTH